MEQGRATTTLSSRTGAVAALLIALLAALVVGVVTLVGGDPHDEIISGAAATATTLRPEPATAPRPAPTSPIATAPPVPSIAPVVSRVDTTEKVIFLGIDDGLARDPAVLDYLQANRIPFTAFLVQGPLQADPAYWQRARSIGGVVEAHTLTHPNLTKVSGDQMRNEICGSADAIQAATGRRPTLFRPPYGAYNDTVRAVAAQCGFYAVVLWKGSTNDGRVDFQENEIKPGDILLMHWRPDLLDNLKQVVAVTQAQGYKIGSLENYLGPLP
jgi:peptidoglycan/xylan/chitin deacetylase (PgdA/CDA1 family)